MFLSYNISKGPLEVLLYGSTSNMHAVFPLFQQAKLQQGMRGASSLEHSMPCFVRNSTHKITLYRNTKCLEHADNKLVQPVQCTSAAAIRIRGGQLTCSASTSLSTIAKQPSRSFPVESNNFQSAVMVT